MTSLSLRHHSRGLRLSPRRKATQSAALPGIVQDGLVAEWRFDDGAGQTLTDYRGGFHGTLGATSAAAADDPTWTAQGLSFDGGDFVSIPSLPTIEGIDIVFRANAVINASSSGQYLLVNLADSAIALGSVTSSLSNEIITLQQNPPDYAAAHRVAWTSAGGSLMNVWHLVQLDRRVATNDWNIVLDGTEVDNATANTPVPAFVPGTWRMGTNATLARFFSGSMAYVNLYGASRSDQQQAHNRAALTAILAARGITLP